MHLCVRSVSFWTQFQCAVSFRASSFTDRIYLHSSFAWFIGIYLALSSLLKYLFADWNKIISLVPPLTNSFSADLPSVGVYLYVGVSSSVLVFLEVTQIMPVYLHFFALAVSPAFFLAASLNFVKSFPLPKFDSRLSCLWLVECLPGIRQLPIAPLTVLSWIGVIVFIF